MSAPIKNTTWGGVKTQGILYDRPGTWNWPSGNAAVTQKPTGEQQYGCDIHAHQTTVRGLNIKGPWFRAFSFRSVSDLLLDSCESDDAGVAGSAHGTGGQAFYGDHLTRFSMRLCRVRRAHGHGLYIAETAQTVRLSGLDFEGVSEHSQLLQLNSESGTGIFDVVIDGSIFHVLDQSTGCANFLGAGKRDQPILVKNSHFKGGRPQSVAVDRSPGNNRPSFVTLQDTTVDQTVFVGQNCILWLTGSSRNVRTTGPGKVVKA